MSAFTEPIQFHKVAQGDIFTPGYHQTTEGRAYMVLEKINKQQGKCIEQHGYSNQRAINGVYNIAPNQTVYPVEE